MSQMLIYPLNKAKITAGYKNDSPGYASLGVGMHYGLDITGTTFKNSRDFFASGEGVVLGYGYAPKSAGNWLAILYKDVLGYGDLVARYFHLEKIYLKLDQKVDINTIIAKYGNTGFSTGYHIHLELDKDIKYWDYTPTIGSNQGGLKLGLKGSKDISTVNPADVLFLKKSYPENQSAEINSSLASNGKKWAVNRCLNSIK